MPVLEHFYAELLINVRIISVSLRVKEALVEDVEVSLNDDGASATLGVQEDSCSVRLPARVASIHPRSFKLKATGAREASARLPLDEAWSRMDDDETTIPWASVALQDVECAHCVNCNRNIIKPGVISAWKDLPSENWAEMMDFWHCHKPDVPKLNGSDDQSHGRGYSASSKLIARVGTALVDVDQFLFSERDVSNVTVGAFSSHLWYY